MAPSHFNPTTCFASIRRPMAVVACLALGPMALCVSARAEDPRRALNIEETGLHRAIQPRQGAAAAGRAFTVAAPDLAAAGSLSREVVLHQFLSVPHGAYPSSGVIRDPEGNLYGTTNGSYSDIGGGGPHDAGVVFKIDPSGHETLLHSFKGTTDGGSPNGLIRDAAGNLYGTASYGGGAAGAGVVFEIDTAGNETVLYTFTGGADGANPNSLIRDGKGTLFGTTNAGGASGYGVVFKIDATGHEKVLHSFTGAADGANPSPNIALDTLGTIYGTTNGGGAQVGNSGFGVVFKVDASGHETVLHTFTGGADGAYPNGVIREANGTLYGTASNGGASGAGVVFDLGTSGQLKVLYSFSGGNDGGSPDAGVTRDPFGNLFGTTNNGGTANVGVVFKLDKAGHETVLHTFVRGAEGNQPYLAGVIIDPESNLYGTTSFSGAGGGGTVYKVDPAGHASVVYAFPGNEGGQYPYNAGVFLGPEGRLYGTTFYGGRNGAGVVYELDAARTEHTLYSLDLFMTAGFGQPTGTLIRDSSGNLYGTTFIGQTNAGFGFGVVYKVDAAGHAKVLHNFTGGADGGDPYGGVVLDSAGNLYGTAIEGGSANSGVVFEIDTSGEETVLYSFSGGADGGSPLGAVIRDSAGNLYGTTNGGGASGAGVVFRVDPAGHETVLYSFTGGADGGYPLGGLVADGAGNLYGVTGGGGSAAGAGVVFQLDSSGHETVLYTFTGGDDGGYPSWVTLARDSAGNLFGTTSGGGSYDEGVVFKVDPSGRETVLHTFTGGDDGGVPLAGVILGREGRLYGTTAFGGLENVGVVFEIKP